MANSSTAATVQPTRYLSDDQFANSGRHQFDLFGASLCNPLLQLAKSGPPELYDWLCKTNDIVITGGLEVPPPPMSCVLGQNVIASPWANMAITDYQAVHPDFAREFNVPRRDGNPTSSEKAADLEHENRYFSAEILAHIFLSYRVTYIQRKHADTPQERTILGNGWVYATARACRELIRVPDFALLSNMSFAVVCCIVDLGAHLVPDIWPAALMTPDRVDAAERGLASDGSHEPSISFDEYQHLGFLPLVLPCNRCANSLRTSTHCRPRICTFPRRDAKPARRVCLACGKNKKASQCMLAFCVPTTLTPIVISDSEESDSPVAVARSPNRPPAASSTVFPRKRKPKLVPSPPPKRGRMTLEPMLDSTPHKLPLPRKRTLTRRRASPIFVVSSALPSVGSSGLRTTSNESAASSYNDAPLPASIQASPLPISPPPPPLSPSNLTGSSFAPTHQPRDSTSTVCGATIDVPLVDLEALVTYYESVQCLRGLIDVAGAARRSRDVIETARRALGDLANLQEQINLRRRYLASLQGDLAEADTGLGNAKQ